MVFSIPWYETLPQPGKNQAGALFVSY